MLWVTFGRARTIGMAFAVGVNMKDENCFAKQSDTLAPIAPAHGVREENRHARRVKTPARLNLRGAQGLWITLGKEGLI